MSVLFIADVSAQTPLNGTYTIGGTAPDYAGIANAVTDLKTKGIAGPVTFNIRSGLYPEKISIPAIQGASSSNKITFKAETGNAADVTIMNLGLTSDGHHVIRLDGADHIHLQNLSITNADPNTGTGIHLTNNADYNLIEKCIIRVDTVGKKVNSTMHAGIVITGISAITATNIFTNNKSGSYNRILNNYIEGGYTGIGLGALTTARERGNVIKNNRIHAFTFSVYAQYNDSLLIENNIFQAFPRISARSGLSVQYCNDLRLITNTFEGNPFSASTADDVSFVVGNSDRFLFRNNQLTGRQTLGFSFIDGLVIENNVCKVPDETGKMNISDSREVRIMGNEFSAIIYDITTNSNNFMSDSLVFERNKVQGDVSILGVQRTDYIQVIRNQVFALEVAAFTIPGGGASANIMVYNNFVSSGLATKASHITISGGTIKNARVLHNTVLNLNTDSRCFNGSGAETLIIKNNIFCHKGSGEVFQFKDEKYFSDFDYNLMYTDGDVFGSILYKVTYSSLGEFQRRTGYAMNAITGVPQFVSNTDLHVTDPLINGMGTPVDLLEDYDLDQRDMVFPDIGADEFYPLSDYDLAIVAADPLTHAAGKIVLHATLMNKGLKSLQGFTIRLSYSTDGGTNWTNPEQVTIQGLSTQNSKEVYTFLTEWEADELGTYPVCIRIQNGISGDINTGNDMFCFNPCIGLAGGVYTVGTPEIPTLTAAFDLIKRSKCGLGGAVVFNILPGIYEERVQMSYIIGASTEKTITFQSSTGNPADVIIRYVIPSEEYTGSVDYTIYLDESEYVTLQNLTIAHTANSSIKNSCPIEIHNAKNILIRNCILKPDTLPVYQDFMRTGIYIWGVYPEGIRIIDNKIEKSKDGIYVNNSFSGTIAGNEINEYGLSGCHLQSIKDSEIRDNKFTGPGTGISIMSGRNLRISGNKISGSLSAGIRAAATDLIVEKNQIQVGNELNTAGSSIFEGIHLSGSSNLISNNMILLGPGDLVYSCYGIYLSGQNNRIFHNTVKTLFTINANDTLSQRINYAMFINKAQSANNTIVNNIFYNGSKGYAYGGYTSSVAESDYNDLYSNWHLARWDDINQPNLASLKINSQNEANSLNISPVFVSETDLHTFDPALNAKGTPLADIGLDIDGHFRNQFTPDIGADEFIIEPFDLALISVSPSVASLGNNQLSVTIQNLGIKSVIDSTILLSYSINGGQTWSAATAFKPKLLSEAFKTEVFVFPNAWNIPEFDVYSLVVRIEKGLTQDLNKINDTIQTEVCMHIPGGIYKVGGAASDFPDISRVNRVLNALTCGITGPVIFELAAGIYNERLSFRKINGSSEQNTITLRPGTGKASDVIISSSGGGSLNDHHTIQFIDAEYVILENLTIENTHFTVASAIHIGPGAKNITVSGCTVKVDSAEITQSRSAILLSDTADMNTGAASGNIIIRNNSIVGGYNGIRLFGPPESNNGIVIQDNVLLAPYAYGIFSSNNNIDVIEGNTISLRENDKISYAVYLINSVSDLQLNRNRMFNGGINLFGVYGVTTCVISNNMIAGSSYNTQPGYGCFLWDVQKVLIAHNTIRFERANGDKMAAFYLFSGNSIRLLNNICTDVSDGYALYVTDPQSIVESDYNVLYTAGSSLAYWQGEHAGLADLQNASNKNLNSQSFYPEFISSANLHSFDSRLDSKAIALAEVANDIDKQVRNALPDVGADEFSLGLDAAVIDLTLSGSLVAGESQEIRIMLSNAGNTAFSNFDVSYSVNGTVQATETFSGTIAVGQSAEHIFQTPWFLQPGTHNLCSNVLLGGDIAAGNDQYCRVITSTGISKPDRLIPDIYPNPFSTFVKIQPRGSVQGTILTVRLFNSQGMLIDGFELSESEAASGIDMHKLPPGLYFLSVSDKHTLIMNKKLVKIN